MKMENINLPKEDWDKLVKKLRSIVVKAELMELSTSPHTLSSYKEVCNPHQTIQKAKQIKIKTLECLDILNQKTK